MRPPHTSVPWVLHGLHKDIINIMPSRRGARDERTEEFERFLPLLGAQRRLRHTGSVVGDGREDALAVAAIARLVDRARTVEWGVVGIHEVERGRPGVALRMPDGVGPWRSSAEGLVVSRPQRLLHERESLGCEEFLGDISRRDGSEQDGMMMRCRVCAHPTVW